MYYINLTEGGHEWVKQNLTTIIKGKRQYDIVKCKHCGIEGKRINLSQIKLKGSFSNKTVFECLNKQIPTRIKITHCEAFGAQFANLLPNTEHNVITPPDGYNNDGKGVWVMGVGEPVKVLRREYIEI